MEAANQSREAITVFAVVFIQSWIKKYSSDCVVVPFFFIFSIPSKVTIIVMQFMFLGMLFILLHDRSSNYLRIPWLVKATALISICFFFFFFTFLNFLLQFLSWISTPLNLIIQKFEDFFPAHIWHQLTRIWLAPCSLSLLRVLVGHCIFVTWNWNLRSCHKSYLQLRRPFALSRGSLGKTLRDKSKFRLWKGDKDKCRRGALKAAKTFC